MFTGIEAERGDKVSSSCMTGLACVSFAKFGETLVEFSPDFKRDGVVASDFEPEEGPERELDEPGVDCFGDACIDMGDISFSLAPLDFPRGGSISHSASPPRYTVSILKLLLLGEYTCTELEVIGVRGE
jgi:hypothetical protein